MTDTTTIDPKQTTTPATPAATTPATILGDKAGDTADTTKQTVPADWPADWRDKLASQVQPGDTKFRERLERFASPVEVARSWRALETKQSSGELKPTLPANATPEQLTAWRKENGVPEKPEDYRVDGVDPANKPLIDAFLTEAHGKNWTQAQVNETLASYATMTKRNEEKIATFDTEYMTKSEDALRAEWGPDYRRNVNAVQNLIAGMPEELSEAFINGRLADGRKIGADPRMIKWLSTLAMEYPSLVVGGPETKSGETRLEEIRKFRRENPDKYDSDKSMQTEELALLERASKARKAA